MITTEQQQRFAEAIKRLGGESDMLTIMAEMAIEDVPPLIVEIDTHVAARRWSAVAASAHSLKGTLSTFESGSPVRDLQLMIDAARSGQVDDAYNHWHQSRPKVEQLLAEIKALCTNS